MAETGFPKLHFQNGFDERVAFEAKSSGYLGGVVVELSNQGFYPVFFYDVVRLSQDLEEEAKQGRPFVAERGMIVVKEVTLSNMMAAIISLAAQGFFVAKE